MLRKIESSFILKKIFMNINYRLQLNLIRYNKRIQKKIELNIVDYRRLSGKYRILYEDGKMEEYDSIMLWIIFSIFIK